LADQHAERAQLITELNRLPRRQRAVLVLRYVEGLSDLEIAGVLECSVGTVRSHASRALSTLRVEMAPTGIGHDDRTAKPDLTRWEPGARELVIDLAGRLDIASSPAETTSWFDANEALNP
jgi:hypothetical protein